MNKNNDSKYVTAKKKIKPTLVSLYICNFS